MRSDRAGTENAGTRPELVNAAEGSFQRGLSGSWQGSAPALLMVALLLHSAPGGVIIPLPSAHARGAGNAVGVQPGVLPTPSPPLLARREDALVLVLAQ